MTTKFYILYDVRWFMIDPDRYRHFSFLTPIVHPTSVIRRIWSGALKTSGSIRNYYCKKSYQEMILSLKLVIRNKISLIWRKNVGLPDDWGRTSKNYIKNNVHPQVLRTTMSHQWKVWVQWKRTVEWKMTTTTTTTTTTICRHHICLVCANRPWMR